MRGEAHELISLSIILPFAYALYLPDIIEPLHIVLFLIGTAVGSLVPDVDAADGRIMHGKYKWVGRFFKYLIYRPIAFLTKEGGHRKVMHSLRGILYSIALMALIIILVLIAAILALNLSLTILATTVTALSFFIGYSVGFALHLFEDMHTVSGVVWLRNGRTWNGPVRTGTSGEWYVATPYMVLGVASYFIVIQGHYLLGPLLVVVGMALILFVVIRIIPETSIVRSEAWNAGRMKRFKGK
jgi:hypothetical protein